MWQRTQPLCLHKRIHSTPLFSSSRLFSVKYADFRYDCVGSHVCSIVFTPFHFPGYVQETAAIILEPVLGEGGFLTPPPGFMAGLRKIANQHGILIIADEVGL